MRKVLTRDEMRAADAAALAAVSHETLVTRAGTAVAHAALRLLGGAYGRRVVVVAGKGSNGADGRVAASVLARRGARVQILEAQDPAAGPGVVLPPCALVIDGAYGTGFRGRYDAPRPPAGAAVLAIDIPSGVDADSGEAPGEAVQADVTVTFAALKPGLLQGDGAVLAGAVEVAHIGIACGVPKVLLVTDADIDVLPARARDGNKWTHAVGVAAGSAGMEGAAVLCTRGAMAAGAGMVRLAPPGDPAAAWPTEAVRVHLPAEGWASPFLESTAKCKVLVVGPGLGIGEATAAEIRSVVAQAPVPLVVDADALRALGTASQARAVLAGRSAPTVLTPHDGEYARLAGRPPGPDRVGAARRLAEETGAVVLLKGPLTAVAAPDGDPKLPDVVLAGAGVPALATAGSGDVLAGIIAAFVARGLAPRLAAALAAHVHGRAAALGPTEGLVSGDLPGLVARVLSEARHDAGHAGADG
ncbi:MAG TPA: NAD(P)H-hydrate dehydratase [Acidimicrobiales bacterium]|nr:NAD(P)H-hydrate dehydratase [Acidimicrobiales bacterium]